MSDGFVDELKKQAQILYNLCNSFRLKENINVDGGVYYKDSLWIPLDVAVDLHNKSMKQLDDDLQGQLAKAILKYQGYEKELDGLKQKIQEALKELVKIIPHETKILTCDEDLTESWIVVSGDPEEWRGFEDRLDGWLEKVKELLGGTKQ
jgi:hypothetical protein